MPASPAGFIDGMSEGRRALTKCHRFAFFDVDETLISMKSMFDFFPYWCAHQGTPDLERHFHRSFARARAQQWTRVQLNQLYYSFFEDAELAAVQAVGQRWYQERFEVQRPPVVSATIARLREHEAQGIEPVFVSGSMQPLLRPIASSLGVHFILCARPRVDPTGRFTGELDPPQTIGAGKAVALTRFLHLHAAAASDCFAYGDDISDVPMLEAVGHPVTVGNNEELRAFGRAHGWAHLPIKGLPVQELPTRPPERKDAHHEREGIA
jgi:HAD superfamily hydrolase (TIGR01490 family)